MIDASLFAPAPHHIQQSHKVDHGVHAETIVNWIPEPAWANAKKQARAQTLGVRYERQIETQLRAIAHERHLGLISGSWLRYNDSVAQPDFILTSPANNMAIVFEVKLTWTDTSNQLALYKALLANIGYEPIITCTICRNITPETPPVIHAFADIKDASVWQIRA